MSIASRNSHTGHIATKLCIVRAFEWPVRSLITTQVHRINTCMETPAAHSTRPLRRQHNTFAPSCIDCRSLCGACTPRWCAAARPTTHYVVDSEALNVNHRLGTRVCMMARKSSHRHLSVEAVVDHLDLHCDYYYLMYYDWTLPSAFVDVGAEAEMLKEKLSHELDR
jgi:hypothetical protein